MSAGAALDGPGRSGHPVTAVVPVKPLPWAKSRLALPGELRRALALAFALDTVATLSRSLSVTGIIVVTADADVERSLRGQPVRLLHDEGGGLGKAVSAGCRAAGSWRPGAGVAVVPADLPCLRTTDVEDVLSAAAGLDGAFVPDRSSRGTTLLVCPPGRLVVPQYGPGSAGRHSALGLRRLDHAPARARHDVDTVEDLDLAAGWGVGARTAAVLAALRSPSAVQRAS